MLEALGLPSSLSLAKIGRKASMEQTAGRKIELSSEQANLVSHPFGSRSLPVELSQDLQPDHRFPGLYCRLLRNVFKDSKKGGDEPPEFVKAYTISDEAFARAVLLL